MIFTIDDGGLLTKDPADISVYTFDWDTDHLAVGVTITTSSFTIAGLSGDITTTPITKDQESILASNRSTKLRLTAGALGSLWRVDNKIVTNESPAQTKERSFFVRVETR